MSEEEHLELIKRAQNGDARAFEELVNLYYGIMFKMAYKWCINKDMAEDITQDACIKLARGLGNFKGQSRFTTWLYRIVINTGHDYIRTHNRNPATHEDLEMITVKAEGEDALYTKEILEAIYKLPEGEREALILVMNDGHTHAEAAEILGVKEGTISWRISEARKKLNDQFGKEARHA